MLKSKATAFKPKARPRANASSTQPPAKGSVERTPATVSQPVETSDSNEPSQPIIPAEVVTVPEVSAGQTPAAAAEESIQPVATTPTSREPTSVTAPVVSQSPLTSTTSYPILNTTKTTTPLEPSPTRNTESQRIEACIRLDRSAVPEEISTLSSNLPTADNTPAQTAPSPSRTASEPSITRRTIDVEVATRTQCTVIEAERAKNATARPRSSGQHESCTSSRPAKRRRVTNAAQDNVVPTIEDETAEAEPARQRRRKPRDPNMPKKKRRASTPDDAAEQVVDHATTKMADLTKDLGIGRVFSMREKILQREYERQEKARLARDRELAEESDRNDCDGESGEHRGITDTPAALPIPSPIANPRIGPTSGGPQLRLVDGQIVLDETSLQVDRHRLALASESELGLIEEDDFTRLVTSATNLKRASSARWSARDTEKFYAGLEMFGTDFEMIAKTFGRTRSRRHIKLKFNREEIEDPARIDRVMTGRARQAMDLGQLRHSERLEDTAAIKAEIAALERAYEERERRQAEAVAEAERRKRAAIFTGAGHAVAAPAVAGGGEDGGPGAGSSKENEAGATSKTGAAGPGPKTTRKTGKKSFREQQQHLGGEDLEILGTI